MRARPVVDAVPPAAIAIESVLDRFGAGALRVAASAGTRIIHLRPGQAYRDRSRTLRGLANGVDDWPVPPAGLFVVEERAVYLRCSSAMTVAHEFAHALDCALGGGVYPAASTPVCAAPSAMRARSSHRTPPPDSTNISPNPCVRGSRRTTRARRGRGRHGHVCACSILPWRRFSNHSSHTTSPHSVTVSRAHPFGGRYQHPTTMQASISNPAA